MNGSDKRSGLQEALESAIRATEKAQKIYNDYLRKVDDLHAVPPLEESAPLVRQLQKNINELFDITARATPDSRWSKREAAESWKQQKDWNAAVVHLLNELIEYTSRASAQTRSLLEQQILFFQQITPWMDAKLHQFACEEELKTDQNHAQLGALITGQDPKKVLAQFYTLQSQLYEQSLANERRLQEITAKLSGSIPLTREMERTKVELEELREMVGGMASRNAVDDTPVPQNLDSTFPKTRDFRYFAFEEIFRGSSEWLKERMKSYVRYFVTAPEPVLDIGCGRGEFLQLMKEIGKNAYGIEQNTYESETLTNQGLNVLHEEILPHLTRLEKDSLGSIFCAQVVEHLKPDEVYQILSRLSTLMKSGSCVVIETINPLSVFAFHHLYFKDPTHIFPVHPQTLAFLLRYTGFQNVEIHPITPVPEHERLPAPASVENTETKGYLSFIVERLNDLLYSNLEYYVVGQKL
jgi:2-polyprenyl-3-methyl-5-hydroxy-6-metoxy-1,4-benzoquinol methylase